MTPNIPAVTSRYSEQELAHWRFTLQGIRWAKQGIGLVMFAYLLFIVMYFIQNTIPGPQNAVGRGARAIPEIVNILLVISALACLVFGFFAKLIGLTLLCFTPRTIFAKFFALGTLVMYLFSNITISQAAMLHYSLTKPQEGEAESLVRALIEFFGGYFAGALMYFLMIVLGCCYLLAVAAEFQNRSLTFAIHRYLKILSAIPGSLLVFGAIFGILIAEKNLTSSWLPLMSVVIVTLLYLWMSYSMIKLLQETDTMILNEVEPGDGTEVRVSNWLNTKPPVIDPLAD